MISIFTTLKQEEEIKIIGGLRPPFIITAPAVLWWGGCPAPLGPPDGLFLVGEVGRLALRSSAYLAASSTRNRWFVGGSRCVGRRFLSIVLKLFSNVFQGEGGGVMAAEGRYDTTSFY